MNVRDFVESYQFEFEGGGSYSPSENEKAMLEDAIQNFVSTVEEMAARVGATFVIDFDKLEKFKASRAGSTLS